MRRAIERKRDGEALAAAEWGAVVSAYTDGAVDDAQMAALLMACVWRGLSVDETHALTAAMVASGQTLTFPADPIVVDKHSSGGVGDIVSLVCVPLVAACGIRVAKLSGRALGHTGGTIDKLETIPGFDVALDMDRFVSQVETLGCAIAAQSDAFVPADKRIYRLRDRTGTIPSIGLLASSIVSKKIAGGAHAFVFDVKCGSGAFMRDVRGATMLAETLVELSRGFGRRAHAIVSDMNEPLGRCIGTGLEVIEARDVLRGVDGDVRIREAVLRVATVMLDAAGIESGYAMASTALGDGRAYRKFVAMVEAQGGSRVAVEAMHPDERVHRVEAPAAGFIRAIDGVALGNAARDLNANGPTCGIRVCVRIGERVERGMTLAEIYGPHPQAHRIAQAFTIGETSVPERPLVYATI